MSQNSFFQLELVVFVTKLLKSIGFWKKSKKNWKKNFKKIQQVLNPGLLGDSPLSLPQSHRGFDEDTSKSQVFQSHFDILESKLWNLLLMTQIHWDLKYFFSPLKKVQQKLSRIYSKMWKIILSFCWTFSSSFCGEKKKLF